MYAAIPLKLQAGHVHLGLCDTASLSTIAIVISFTPGPHCVMSNMLVLRVDQKYQHVNRGYIGLYRSRIGIMEKKMETTTFL